MVIENGPLFLFSKSRPWNENYLMIMGFNESDFSE